MAEDQPDWFIDLGDGTPTFTTQAIARIEKELQITEQIHRDSVCMVCDQPGLHCHWI